MPTGSQHPCQLFKHVFFEHHADIGFPLATLGSLGEKTGIPKGDHRQGQKEHRLTSKAGEAEVQNIGLLDWLSPKQTAVCKANAAPSRDVLNVKKEDSGYFVNKQESDGGDVEEKEEKKRRYNRHTNAGLWDVGEQLNKAKTEQSSLFHVG